MDTTASPSSAPQYAGFWMRFLSHLIDNLIVGVASGIIVVPILLVMGMGAFLGASSSPDQIDEEAATGIAVAAVGAIALVVIAVSVITWLYYALMESSSKQGTLGKIALGLQVTDMQGNRISFGRATGRYFGKIISGAVFMIGYIMAGFTQQKQALHDILAGCLVVRR
jgi:uncharacterized RDD family membrane protein YckC